MAAIQEVRTNGKHFSRANTRTISQHDLQLQINNLLATPISNNTKKSYETGLRAFENFRLDLGYQQIWPPPLDHVVQFIAFLSCKDYTYSTARAYVSAISFQSKIHNIADITKNFIVSKLLGGMKRIKKSVDSRLPITLSLF